MTLNEASAGNEYVVAKINTDDEEMKDFLFSLGCYSGETVSVVSIKNSGLVVSIKDGRYCIDSLLAQAIEV